MEAIDSSMYSAGDKLESADQTDIDAGISRTIGFQAEEAIRGLSGQGFGRTVFTLVCCQYWCAMKVFLWKTRNISRGTIFMMVGRSKRSRRSIGLVLLIGSRKLFRSWPCSSVLALEESTSEMLILLA